MEFIGYHGTTMKSANRILKGNFYTPTHQGWLGCGTYFFEGNLLLAKEFARCRHKTNEIAVIKCDIKSNLVLDLTVPSGDGVKKFHQTRAELLEACRTNCLNVKAKNFKDFAASVIESLCKRENYDLVRANTYTYTQADRILQITSHVPNGTELCVKKRSSILRKTNVPLEYIV